MASITWGREVAEGYDDASASMFEPAALDPTVDLLVELAFGGPVLEFAVGTGRVALPLSALGLRVSRIELSPHMVEQLRAKSGSQAVAVTIGDMTSVRVPGSFSLVYLVWNAIMNVTTQEEQVAMFLNAATHLEPSGYFLVEVAVPQPPRRSPEELGRVFSMKDDRVGIDTYDDPVGQILSSHHWIQVDSLDTGRLPPCPSFGSLPLCLAVGARLDGTGSRAAFVSALGRVAQGTVHRGERQPGRGIEKST